MSFLRPHSLRSASCLEVLLCIALLITIIGRLKPPLVSPFKKFNCLQHLSNVGSKKFNADAIKVALKLRCVTNGLTAKQAPISLQPRYVIIKVFYLLFLIVSYKFSIYYLPIRKPRTRGHIIDSITLNVYALQSPVVFCKISVLAFKHLPIFRGF